ncbi:copper homeostasis membrane protein CopD [Lichenicoccus roseus]|uniref:Copper homeostasis membrane protein CopD n=1 Tax=Lichenicoccus roseus TaxID=2683649 RepID=A0A5R9J0B4_9PROT|nr:copper homeostasis membrane protein CopD [Lichenicoccus roseus]TLU71115.1 copper homeostasis membrane protein CopD [Lichenicoccus roseus]
MSLSQTVLVLARTAQYAGTSGLFGGGFFLARQHPDLPTIGERRLLVFCGLMLVAATMAALVLQAADMAGGADPAMMAMVMTSTSFGHAAVSRLIVVATALLLLLNQPSSLRLWLVTVLGAVATTSLAWGGHGMSGDGTAGLVHFAADIIHLLAAAIWIGALGILTMMVMDHLARTSGSPARRLDRALSGFSGVGTAAVALLILSGLINSWFLVGPNHLWGLFTTLYGRLLLIKLALFMVMLGLAALHRWRLTPRLQTAAQGGADIRDGVIEIRRSIALETVSAVLVLGLVAWFGTLAPPDDG